MIIHKDFKGDITELNKCSRMKNIKSIQQIVESVIKSYSYKNIYYTRSLKELLKIINNDSKILNNFLEKNKSFLLKYRNILIMNKFINYTILLKLLKNNKSKYDDEKYKIMLQKYKDKFKYYGKLFFKNNKKLNKDSEILNDEEINKLLFNCKLA